MQWDLDSGKAVRHGCVRQDKDVDFSSCEANFGCNATLLALSLNTVEDLYVHYEPDHLNGHKLHTSNKRLVLRSKSLQATYLEVYRLEGDPSAGWPTKHASLTVAWRPGPPNALKGIQFSEDGRGLLASLSWLSDWMPGCVVLWPNWGSSDVSFALSGTHGCWSRDGHLVVTWESTFRVQGNGPTEPSGGCLVWDVHALTSEVEEMKEKLGSGETGELGESEIHELFPGHPGVNPRYCAKKCILLRDRDVKTMLWASFVFSQEGHRLATCTIDRHIKVVIWDVERRVPTHVLNTRIKRDVSLAAWACNFAADTASVAVSADQRWLGLYVAPVNKGFVWNVVQGVTFLELSLPDDLIEDYFLGFGGPGWKLSMCGHRCTLLWDTRALTSAEHTGNQMMHYTLPDVSPDGLLMESVSGQQRGEGSGGGPIIDLKFSLNGDRLGVIRRDSSILHVFDFHAGNVFLLKEESAPASRFQKFNFSPGGGRLAAVMSGGRVLLWDLHAGPEAPCQNSVLADLKVSPRAVQFVQLCSPTTRKVEKWWLCVRILGPLRG